MIARLRSKLTYANVMATVAVFIALGGTATAVTLIDGRRLRSRSVPARALADNSIGSGKIRDGSLLRRDFKRGQLPGAGRTGARGATGRTGRTGARGATGMRGLTGARGATGATGRTILNGTAAPTAGQGSNGDFFVNTSTLQLYGPKAGGVWGSPTSLVGPQGPAGPAGTLTARTGSGASFSPPAGSYLASAVVQVSGTAGVGGQCQLTTPTASTGVTFVEIPAGGSGSFVVSGVLPVTGGQAVTPSCSAGLTAGSASFTLFPFTPAS